jgi:hypothetical protein
MSEVAVEDAAAPARQPPEAARGSHAGTVRTAFLGASDLVENHAPAPRRGGPADEFFPVAPGEDPEHALAEVNTGHAQVTVIFDPEAFPADALRSLSGVTLGVLTDGARRDDSARSLVHLDRVVSFDPALTGTKIGRTVVWRAISPPVSDRYYGEVRELHHKSRVMSIGRSTSHRETMLIEAKHHHDLLQVVHGVSGALLVELLRECDVGVYVAPDGGGAFGAEVGVHLAAGHLLISEPLIPARGLEADIDYLQFGSPDGLSWMLERLARFPEMYQRVRVRGHLKAEQFRASRVFARLTHDLLADVAAFGGAKR